jgi:hypothetical protein
VSPYSLCHMRMMGRQAHQHCKVSAAQECREGTEGRSYRLGCPPTVFFRASQGAMCGRLPASPSRRGGASLAWAKMSQCQRHPMIWQTHHACRYAALGEPFRRGPTRTMPGFAPRRI